MSEIRADANRLYLDAAHELAMSSDDHSATVARARLRVDGCAAVEPLVSGSVWRDWSSPSTVSVSLQALPDGELDLTLEAFGLDAMVPLKKHGKSITYLETSQRAGYRVDKGDPVSGIGLTATLGPRPNCGGQP